MHTGSSPHTGSTPSTARLSHEVGNALVSFLAASSLLLAGAFVLPGAVEAQHDHDHGAASHQPATESDRAASSTVPLQEPGNAAFAAIQEVVAELNARGDDTDWSRVDLEALRQHLIDMERFILEAEVVEREEIEGGIRVAVRGPDPEIHRSLRRSLHAHAPMLEQETGWTVSATDRDGLVVLEARADSPDEAERIQGLGYVGLMVTGSHHREHHWMIANGEQPHAHGH